MDMSHAHLEKAKRKKDDEFYTQLCDIENELKHYAQYFNGKKIYCNCDNPSFSQFFIYFLSNFTRFKIKSVIFTFYADDRAMRSGQHPYRLTITDGGKVEKAQLRGNGDFRTRECEDILEQCDMVITNPPFSLWLEHFAQCMKHHKDIILIGLKTLPNTKEVFHYFMNDIVSYGYTSPNSFTTVDGKGEDMNGLCRWYTTLPVTKRKELILTKTYSPYTYKKFDNGDVINVDDIKDIPYDYDGVMGVPCTFFDYYDKDEWEILNTWNRYAFVKNEWWIEKGKYATNIDGKPKFSRILIRRRKKCPDTE